MASEVIVPKLVRILTGRGPTMTQLQAYVLAGQLEDAIAALKGAIDVAESVTPASEWVMATDVARERMGQRA